MDLELDSISKSFKHRAVLKEISFGVGPEELVSIVGPSGVGKTTLLNIIAGMEPPDTGKVVFSSPPSKESPVIMVFQDYVLFAAMTVSQNIGFGLKARKRSSSAIKKEVGRMLDYFGLTGQARLYPAQLSAGQKQRVAIARAMIVNPGVLLLDEPFANLDRNLKMETARFIRQTQQEFGIPTISVTHDLSEAFAMSDLIGVLLGGRVRQFDTPEQTYYHPVSREVAEFLGPVNIIPGTLYSLFDINSREPEILARPEALEVEPSDQGPGKITEKMFAGHYTAYTISLNSSSFTVYSQKARLAKGCRVRLGLKPEFK